MNTSNYAQIPDSASLDISSSFTISVWFNASALGARPTRLVDKTTAGFGNGYMLDVWTGGFRLGGGPTGAVAKISVSTSVLHHVAVNFSQGVASFYLDGQFISSGNIGATSEPVNNLPLRIGASQGGGSSADNFNGMIDEVRIYSRTLSDTEIATLAGVVVEKPIISASPTNLLFGQQPVGKVAKQTVTLSNTVTGTLDIGALNLNGDADFTFDTNSCNNAHLVKDATCQFTVGFKAASAGIKSGYVVVPSNGVTGRDLQVGLTGEGIAVDTSADLGIELRQNPKTMDTNKAYPVSFTVTNHGKATATKATVTVTLPKSVSPRELGACKIVNSNTITCTVDTFATTDSFTPSFKIVATNAAIGNATLVASVSADNADKNTANNKVTAAISIGSVVTVKVAKIGTGLGTITSDEGKINCDNNCSAAVKFPLTTGGTIVFSETAGLRSKWGKWTDPNCKAFGSQPSCVLKTGGKTAFSITGQFDDYPAEKVILLLHGMNSQPSTWDVFVTKSEFGSCLPVSGGKIIGNQSNKNSQKTYCYAVQFGIFDDKNKETGLENAKKWATDKNVPKAGDFSTFDQLGEEVKMALQAISVKHPGAHVLLIGHSRGGLAARAFLYSNDNQAKRLQEYIDGLLTTGTPHKGSHIGKIYSWLQNNSRTSCDNKVCKTDWKVVDFLLKPLGVLPYKLDSRRPVIDYLAFGSKQIIQLNKGTFPINKTTGAVSIKTGQLRYGFLPLGKLSGQYTIFSNKRNGLGSSSSTIIGSQLSEAATDFILGTGNNADLSDYIGDGIVHLDSQDYNATDKQTYTTSEVLHIDEPKRVSEINAMICKMGFKWIPSCPK